MRTQSILDVDFELELPCVKVSQPIGDFYIASIDSANLREITFSDVRRMVDNEVDRFLGIQREVNPKRVKEIGRYVNTVDACFPTAVILAVPARCAEYDEARRVLTLRSALQSDDEQEKVNRMQIARVLDGQHRIEGLEQLAPGHPPFQVNVSIFVEADIESQAYLFSVVNLQQTKVSKSLVYDLFDFAKTRSPQKTAHQIAVALNLNSSSPLHGKIKRLGVATHGRFTETLTQATFVEALMPYLSLDPVKDRDVALRGKSLIPASAEELRKTIFRNMFIAERDLDIADIIFNYFSAIATKWDKAWVRGGDGAMLVKTNGFKALMRLLRPAYLRLATPGQVVSREEFSSLIGKAIISDDEFTTDNFKPGTSGETALFHRLMDELGLQ